MLKGRGRDPRGVTSPSPANPSMRSPGLISTIPGHPTMRLPGLVSPTGHPTVRSHGGASPIAGSTLRSGQASPISGHPTLRSSGMGTRTGQQQRALPARPEPDYEVVEFPSDQYVNAKLQPPPPPPPRPPTGHPAQAGASCGLCGGGGARVRCAECGRRALCASCDDMYHRHPKRRHHQRQALSLSQLGEERPPLPPKGTPPVPPPRRHKTSSSPMPPMTPVLDQRRSTLNNPHSTMPGMRASASPTLQQSQVPHPIHVQAKIVNSPNQIGSMPFLPTTMPHQHQQHMLMQPAANTLGQLNAWNRPRGSLQGFNVPQMQEPWDGHENVHQQAVSQPQWGRPMRRGASTLELGGGGGAVACAGCAQCAPSGWRYGSCAALDQPWAASQAGWPMQSCCPPQQQPHGHFHMHQHVSQTPQPYRRADSRAMSRAGSRTGSRAGSPALSVRSRASRRTKHRTPSPQLPSSDADSESESDSEPPPKPRNENSNMRPERPSSRSERPSSRSERPSSRTERPSSHMKRQSPDIAEDASLGPAPPPPAAPWQCEHCTYVNEAGVRVCVICCRTPTAAPKVVNETPSNFEKLKINSRPASPVPVRVDPPRVEQVSERIPTKPKKERTSTGCGPSPPREEIVTKKITQRLVTPTREQNGSSTERNTRHDMAVGPSPPKETRSEHNSTGVGPSPPRDTRSNHNSIRSPSVDRRDQIRSPYPQTTQKVERHSVSVGPSPPRENRKESIITGQKKFDGTSPPRDVRPESRSSIAGRTNVSNTGTSPPPQSISTQTYEDTSTYERAASVSRSRPRRRFREERRERSHSRHSLSSDTRESERSVRTTGAWEWRERDSSPGGAGWGGGGGGSGGGRGLARRASHLDVRRRDHRRTSLYGSEAPSPEPPGRALSMEVLTGAGLNAERGLELARLLAEAERLGFSAAEVQVGLSQSPRAPLAWLRSRWAGLAGAVAGAVARLAPEAAPLDEAAARAALARHRGAVWPAVTECVDALRRQSEGVGRVRGRVWGAGAGADDDAAPRRAEDSSDEYDAPAYLDDWYPIEAADGFEIDREIELWSEPPPAPAPAPAPLPPLARDSAEVALKLRSLLLEAGIPSVDDNLLKGLLNGASTQPAEPKVKPSLDFIQSENDFIDAYNALTRASPLPNISKPNILEAEMINESNKEEQIMDDEMQQPNGKEPHKNIVSQIHHKHKNHTSKQNTHGSKRIESKQVENKQTNNEKQRPRMETAETVPQNQTHSSSSNEINNIPEATQQPQTQKDDKNMTKLSDSENAHPNKQTEEKSNNLNEIVDNTQKLIQQMKEEINSDIHSLDDGHSQTSLSNSDQDTSSHDEQESSYSETDDESNRISMSSDEKEMSSSSEDEVHNSNEVKRSPSQFLNRTSSEDNEQFEEALDNLDNQIEDVKHANIEILDSIARSLQEEHTISVVLNGPGKNSLHNNDAPAKSVAIIEPRESNRPINDSHNISIVIDSPNGSKFRREDSNNNVFVEVNSFEEIYAELNSSNQINKLLPHKITYNIEPKKEVTENVPVQPKILFTKFEIKESVFKIVSPTRVVISENKEPVFNAVLDNIETPTEETVVESASEVVHYVEEEASNNELVNVDHQEIFTSEPIQNLNESILPIAIRTDPEVTEVADLKSNDNLVNNNETTEVISQVIANIPVENDQQNMTTQNETHTTDTQPIIAQQTSHEIINQTNNVNKTSTATGKSSIPKPVKTANKAKNDKTAPKLLVSKVPVRRGSLKQHHAPAPPKSHFGNVQSGHVKQLQSKVFSAKEINPTKPRVTEIDMKPSTSTATVTKKNPAPQPPGKQEKQPSPSKSPPSEEKRNNYFRETCRTEDEWTESDSDEPQSVRRESVVEVEVRPASPPPPVTLRLVNGNLIDLATVRLSEGSPERQARMLLAGGATETWAQARLAVELAARGAELPAALLAALACEDLSAALAYLHHDCELCAERLPQHEMVSMLRCTHRCCRECARLYYTVQITERSIIDCVCPFCKMPELESLSEDAWLEYFSHLDIQLKTLLETDVHELFQRKLRDRTLAMDPNFKWCVECSSGFFVHPKQKKLRCPECRSVTCASCRKPWSSNHDGLSCEQYATWLADNDPEVSVAAVQQHLKENGLECPRCHFKYSLSRGGCMHFTCTQCKYEFCNGCGKPFTMGARCGLSDYCAKLGLHAHHPRNCLFYLRDKEPHELQTLLQMNNVAYEIEAPEGNTGRCPIPLQRETPAGLVDGICGSEVPPKHAGLCKNHYLEYLTARVRGCSVDPLPLLAVDDLETLVKRAGLRLPPRPYGSLEGLYRRALTEIVKEKIPLD